jgi:hypothetical protein
MLEVQRHERSTYVLGDARGIAGFEPDRLQRRRMFIAVRSLEWQALNVRSVSKM